MKLKLKKETLVILSNDTQSLPIHLTPQVAGGVPNSPTTITACTTNHPYCGDGQTSALCTSLATCDDTGTLPTEGCTGVASEDFQCRTVD